MKEINEAYEVLADPVKRSQYNETLFREKKGEVKLSQPFKTTSPLPSRPYSSTSDQKTIEFIKSNINNEEKLAKYFSTLNTPLTSPILTFKLSSPRVPEKKYSFLAYAAHYHKKSFKDIVRLATVDAIDAVLSEDPVNGNSMPAMYDILYEQARNRLQGVDELIQKSSASVISAVLTKHTTA
jgi:curved DNA-binding protein CbpA